MELVQRKKSKEADLLTSESEDKMKDSRGFSISSEHSKTKNEILCVKSKIRMKYRFKHIYYSAKFSASLCKMVSTCFIGSRASGTADQHDLIVSFNRFDQNIDKRGR